MSISSKALLATIVLILAIGLTIACSIIWMAPPRP